MTETTEHETYDPQDLLYSLSGYEELAVKKAFGAMPMDLEGSDFLRGLLYAAERRRHVSTGGKPDDTAAKKAVMALSLRQVQDRFETSDEEPFADEPVTAAGKDDEPTV